VRRWYAVLALVGLLLAGCGAAPPAADPSGPAEPVGKPAAVYIPKIDAASSLIPLGTRADNGQLEVPNVKTPLQAGYWTGSAPPGQPGRPLVIPAHVNGGGRAGLYARLHELQPGDQITVSTTVGQVFRYVVYASERVPKSRFPTELSTTPPSGLNCGPSPAPASSWVATSATRTT